MFLETNRRTPTHSPGAGRGQLVDSFGAGAYAELTQCVGFTAQDAANLHSLGAGVEKYLPHVARQFFEQLGRFAGARDVLMDDSERHVRLQDALTVWLRSLFSGRYDEDYFRQRLLIGRMHQRLGISQHYVFAAMEVVRRELTGIVRAVRPRGIEAKLESLQKLLVLENTLIAGSFQDAYVEEARTRERDAMQERLTQAEHLAEIGRLAASLAHEIKNPLAGISGAVQVIRDATPAEDPHRPILAEVLRQINRLDQTVKDLLVYARPVPPRFDRCNISRVVERLMTVLNREPAMQRIRFEHQSDHRPLPSIEADDNQIEQLLMNLVLNAAHASRDGGAVILRTKLVAEGIQLEVEDYGQGMDASTCQRALEPFFTTKSRGTGLGLPICQRIAEAHHGALTIQSELGRGTLVTVRLPLAQPAHRGGEFG